ncbi:MAG TPA: hypothetical protein VMG33_03930 [Steroidobacteraceae bacterium]|nr:hypothetical protein [Steroidobacteraceae bacterium]
MRLTLSLLTVLLGYALLAAAAVADPPPPADPDPGFLEFLGSVDGLAEVNPNYLTQATPAPSAAKAPTPAAPPPQPAPNSVPGVKNNE